MTTELMTIEKKTYFGHHPDPEIDLCIEVERLQGLLYEAKMGLLRGLDYRAATPEGLQIKNDIRRVLRSVGVSDGEMGYRSQF